MSERAAQRLARIQAGQAGEDQVLSSELLSESLEALQALPEASLFHSENVNKVWLEVVERSNKFLSGVVAGGGQCSGPPEEDRHLALALLCKLAIQRGQLFEMLSKVVLLLNLWSADKGEDSDNRLAVSSSAAPLLPLIRRQQGIPDPGACD